MKVEVSNGEIVDKISILMIKLEKITDIEKIANIEKELSGLFPFMTKMGMTTEDESFKMLKDINLTLWDIEDSVRELESKQDFGENFVKLARQVYYTNDHRFKIKSEINTKTGSSLKEEKSYEEY